MPRPQTQRQNQKDKNCDGEIKCPRKKKNKTIMQRKTINRHKTNVRSLKYGKTRNDFRKAKSPRQKCRCVDERSGRRY